MSRAQRDLSACRTRFDRSRQPTTAAPDHDDVVNGFAHRGACAARSPAVVPAMRPNTEPFTRPVPPG